METPIRLRLLKPRIVLIGLLKIGDKVIGTSSDERSFGWAYSSGHVDQTAVCTELRKPTEVGITLLNMNLIKKWPKKGI